MIHYYNKNNSLLRLCQILQNQLFQLSPSCIFESSCTHTISQIAYIIYQFSENISIPIERDIQYNDFFQKFKTNENDDSVISIIFFNTFRIYFTCKYRGIYRIYLDEFFFLEEVVTQPQYLLILVNDRERLGWP